MVREKVVACAARKVVILVGAEKRVTRLGQHRRLPGEVVPFAIRYVMRRLREPGFVPSILIDASGREFLSDNGNLEMDCGVRLIKGPARLERELCAIPGVVGTGLFLGIASVVLLANSDGSLTTLERRR